MLSIARYCFPDATYCLFPSHLRNDDDDYDAPPAPFVPARRPSLPPSLPPVEEEQGERPTDRQLLWHCVKMRAGKREEGRKGRSDLSLPPSAYLSDPKNGPLAGVARTNFQ